MRHRRRRLHGDPYPRRQGHDDRLPRGVAGAMRPDSFIENGTPLTFERGPLQRPVRGRARARLPAGSAPCAATAAGRFGGRCGRASRSRARASPSTRRSSRQTVPNIDCFDDIPSTRRALPRRRTAPPRDVGDTLAQPRPRAHLPPDRRPRRRAASTAASSPGRWSTPRRTRRRRRTPTTSGGPA